MSEPRDEYKEADYQTGVSLHENDNAVELGAKQAVENREVVSFISENSSSGALEKGREESEVVVNENRDAPQARQIELESANNGCGHDTADEDNLEELMKNRKAIRERHPDKIYICSLEEN